MAEVSPAWMASCRNTEFSTMRAAGLSPKDTLDSPSVVWIPGYVALICRIASMVSMASRRVSSWPVAIGKVSASSKMSLTATFQSLTRVSTSRLAIRTFPSVVRAWPSSSIVRATTAAPCSFTSGMIRANREVGPSPSSKFTELITGRPPMSSSPACSTAGSVESITSGSVEALAKRETTSRISATPSRPT